MSKLYKYVIFVFRVWYLLGRKGGEGNDTTEYVTLAQIVQLLKITPITKKVRLKKII